MFKKVISAIFAIIAAAIILGLIVKIMGFALQLLFGFIFLVVIIAVALPLYIVIKNKLFK